MVFFVYVLLLLCNTVLCLCASVYVRHPFYMSLSRTDEHGTRYACFFDAVRSPKNATGQRLDSVVSSGLVRGQ